MTDYERLCACMSCCAEGIKCFCDDKEILNKYIKFFPYLDKPKRRPDAFSILDDELLILEHFQFDNTLITKKGSSQHRISAKTNRELERKTQESNNYIMVNEIVKKSGKYYIENFITKFISHYQKIDNYKQELIAELKREFKKIYVGFVVEDSSPLGSIYLDKYTPCILDLTNTIEFLNIFEQSSKLDFIFFSMTGNDKNLYQSFISRKTLHQHKLLAIPAENIKSFLFEDSIVSSIRINL